MATATQGKGRDVAEELYFATATQYRRERTNEECDAWMRVLGDYDAREIRCAIDDWECDTTIETFTDRPRGSRMPMAAEVKSLIELRKRLKSQAERFQPCGECESGWVRVYEGLTLGSKDVKKSPVDQKVGAVRLCQCRADWIASQKNA